MRKITGLLLFSISAAAVTLAAALIAPATALAAGPGTLWVNSGTTISGNGTSCTAPGFNSIQSAINAASPQATIEVCEGTYTEQLQITKPVTINGVGNVEVTLPTATPIADATTACDTAKGTGSFQPDQDGISICGDVSVTLNNIVVDAAWPAGTCDGSLYGILVAGGATLHFTNSEVTAAGAVPLNGCQGGIGIQVGMAWTSPVEVGHLAISDSEITGYQKNGITVDGYRSTATTAYTTVWGAGRTSQIAQNGIQVSNGAKADINTAAIGGNECNLASVCGSNNLTQTQSAGVLFFGALRGTTITNSYIANNDMGVYYEANPAGRAPTQPQVVITNDTFTDNRYEGVTFDEGRASLTHCTISRGNIGIEVLQYGGTSGGQTFGSNSVASFDTMTHMHVATVDVLSDRAATGDRAGKFTITHSEIDTAPVLDNSKNLPIIKQFDF